MNYKPKLPDDSVNVSESNMGIYGFKVIGGFALFLVSIYIILAVFSDYFVRFIPPETENRIFGKLSNLCQQTKNVDASYQKKAEQLLAQIPESVKPDKYDFSISVSKDEDINAFAMPGGCIILTKGLMDEIKTDNALTFVIGHEIGHYHGRDHLKGISRQIISQTLAAIVLGQSSADLSSIDKLINLSVDSHYSRNAESKADIWGVETLVATFGHATGATLFLEKALAKEGEGLKWSEAFSTHPLSSKRIKALEEYIASNGYHVK